MKYLTYALIVLMTIGCDIESAIGNASERCEDEIAKIIENIEASCITKDELLDIIDSVRTQNDQSTGHGVDAENKDSLDETS